MAKKIIINAKMRNTSICGATETLLIHKKNSKFVNNILQELRENGCEIYADSKVKKLYLGKTKTANEKLWSREFLSAKISVKLVKDIYEAIHHINKYGTMHTDSIITKNKKSAKIFIKNVKSSTNTTKADNTGYNGFFTVASTPSSKIFTYTNTNTGFGVLPETADVVGIITSLRSAGTASDLAALPMFERSEYDTTYTVQEVDTIQDYIADQQDGVYYLTCLIGNISPTVSEFSNLRYRQNFANLYPTVDKDNPNNDPVQAVSAASNELLGKVHINDPINSLTKETAINYLRDNRVGFAITFAESNGTTGITTYTTDVEHNLNAITKLDISVAGLSLIHI